MQNTYNTKARCSGNRGNVWLATRLSWNLVCLKFFHCGIGLCGCVSISFSFFFSLLHLFSITMYSPRRTATDDYDTMLRSPERSNMAASPLRAIASPFYKAVKTAQSKASRDFDKFYGSLQQKLTPRTSQARIQKQTPDTTERMRAMLQQRRAQADNDSTRTSLTPLIERHTLQEGGFRWP